jgi:hypothetical protein
MYRRLLLLIILGACIPPARARAGCEWYGTQLDCAIAGRRVVIGTQAADEPRYTTLPFDPQPFQGNARLLDDRPRSEPSRIEIQDIGRDPSLCRRIGDETYCY